MSVMKNGVRRLEGIDDGLWSVFYFSSVSSLMMSDISWI